MYVCILGLIYLQIYIYLVQLYMYVLILPFMHMSMLIYLHSYVRVEIGAPVYDDPIFLLALFPPQANATQLQFCALAQRFTPEP